MLPFFIFHQRKTKRKNTQIVEQEEGKVEGVLGTLIAQQCEKKNYYFKEIGAENLSEKIAKK